MTKADLIEDIYKNLGTTYKESELLLETILNSMVRALRAGDKVEIRGFGTLRTRSRGARIARNPRTGVRVEVPAKRIAHFKVSRELLAALNRR